jgi:hypothetical protein
VSTGRCLVVIGTTMTGHDHRPRIPSQNFGQAVTCATGAAIDDLEQTAAAGSATLSYDAATGRYTYVWKTDKAWRGCRQLSLTFVDGTTKTALFVFR